MEAIEPDHFDVVVVSSGLPEVLIASALARAGKSVLLLDSTESYGGSWATLSGPDYVHSIITRHLEHQLAAKQQQQQDAPHQECAGSSSSSSSTASSIALRAVQPLAGASGVSLYTHPDVEQALENKQLLMDLAPRVLYQGEAMVDLLVACQAHNYLEFKLIEGSYIYLNGRLRPVPASRAELFADKALPLAAKRCLGRFLAACVEAQQGCGRLKDAFDDRPLVELLAAEGLDEQLQQVVLYGIAMADTPQQQQPGPLTSSLTLPQAAAEQQVPATDETRRSVEQPASTSKGLLTAAEGLAALQLYSSSLGRYGGAGAFMAPCYGSGSLPEAFVRLAAVKGAVTALRHGAVKLELQAQQQQQQPAAGACGQTSASSDASEAGATGAAVAVAKGEAAAAARVGVVLASGQRLTANAVVACSAVATGHSAAAQLETAATASSAADASATPQGQQQQQQVACAVALLDGSAVDGESSLLLVFPPGSLGTQQTAVIRGLQLGPAFGVAPPGKYLLYLSAQLPASSSSIRGSSSSSSLAEQVLAPAVHALAAGKGLQALQFVDEEQQEAEHQQQQQQQQQQEAAQQQQQQQASSSSLGAAATAAAAAVSAEGTRSSEQPQHEQQQAAATSLLPQVMAVCYFTRQQPEQQFSSQLFPPAMPGIQQQDSSSSSSSSGGCRSVDSAVLWCPAAAQGFMGYSQTIEAAEAAYRQQFPGLPWLTDAVPQPAAATQSAAAGSSSDGAAGAASTAAQQAADGAGAIDGGAGAGGGVLDDGELDAIDELTAALLELSAPPKEQD